MLYTVSTLRRLGCDGWSFLGTVFDTLSKCFRVSGDDGDDDDHDHGGSFFRTILQFGFKCLPA